MLYDVKTTGKFDRDIRLAKKRGLNENDLFEVVKKLANDENLPAKNHDHALKGDFKGKRECHINPDWLLIYKKEKTIQLITLVRTGTHADLYGK
ncbi:MAG: type II toxin-antitoxin system YafQ family toxin [Bacteroidales bacterium]|nr:type II toxin-antitoxin system YafQ family toxin [Bacteroidales bacterium]